MVMCPSPNIPSSCSPGHQHQCPPHCGPCGHPVQCPGTAAPAPQGRCKSCSQTLSNEKYIRATDPKQEDSQNYNAIDTITA